MTSPRVLILAPLALLALFAPTATARPLAFAASHPSLTKLHASPGSLPSGGGKVKITARVKHAEHCKLKSSPPVPGLPHTVKCNKKTVTFHVTMPANSSTSAKVYSLTLKALGDGSKSARVKVTVAASASKEVHVEQHEHLEGEREHERSSYAPAVQVSTGEKTTCAVLSNGKVYCWGEDVLGEVGNDAKEVSVLKPFEVPLTEGAKQVEVGEHDACALLSGGHVECWGENGRGQIGNGNVEEDVVLAPTQVIDVEHAVSIGVGWRSACALIEGGTVKCWGENALGQIGSGKEPNEKEPSPTPEEAKVKDATSISVYFKHVCAVISGGKLECWGYDFFGELGNLEEDFAVKEPVEDIESKHVTEDAIGHYSNCVLEGGKVYCWGENHEGQLGDGAVGEYRKPELEPQEADGVGAAVEVATGWNNSCARLSDDHVKCWGENKLGDVGDGKGSFSEPAVDVPAEVLNLSEAAQLSVGTEGACAVVKSGRVYCWGDDERGQAGDEQEEYERGLDEPHEVAGLP